MDDTLEHILRRAIWAPSGDNEQPWRFVRSGETIRVYNRTAHDDSFYNHGQVASLMSIGALLENVRLAASAEHKAVHIALSPEGDVEWVASITLDGAADPDALHTAIEARTSNRKPYDASPLPRTLVAALSMSASNITDVHVTLAEDISRDQIATLCAVNERVVLENKAMHDFFFSHITWNEEEDAVRPGFFIDTLELNAIQKKVFRIYRVWPIAKVLNAMGMALAIARENARIYSASAATAVISIQSQSPTSYVHAGMVMQRMWLTATAEGFMAQPMAGVCFLAQYARSGTSEALSRQHARLIMDAYNGIEAAANDIYEPILVLRIGRAPAPTARTRRAPLVIEKAL